MIFCPECGSQHYPGTLFCDMCGAAVHPSARAYLETNRAAVARMSPIRAGDERYLETPPALPRLPDEDAAPRPIRPPALRVRIIHHDTEMTMRGTHFNVGRTDPYSDFVPELDLTRFDGQSRGVSRRHATIRWDEAAFVICDNHSSNGTWLNGERLEAGREFPLPAASAVRFGGLLVQLTIAD